MRAVNIAAGLFFLLTISPSDADLSAVFKAKPIIVTAVDESDAPLRLLHMLVQPILPVAITVQIVFASVRVEKPKDKETAIRKKVSPARAKARHIMKKDSPFLYLGRIRVSAASI